MARGVEIRLDYLPTGEYVTEEFEFPRDHLSWTHDRMMDWQQARLQEFANKHSLVSIRLLDHYDDWE